MQDVRLKFRRSSIGPAWIFVNLTVMVLSIGFIYANLLGQDTHEFIPYLTIGMILWGYLTNSIVDGGNAFIHSEGYIRQISLPIYVYIFRSFVSISVTMLITMLAFVIVAVVYRLPVGPATLLAIPGLLMLMTTALLLITIFAHLNARFRDVAHMAAVGMQVLFYVTPVIFPASLLQRRARPGARHRAQSALSPAGSRAAALAPRGAGRVAELRGRRRRPHYPVRGFGGGHRRLPAPDCLCALKWLLRYLSDMSG